MERMVRGTDLTISEMHALREVAARNFVSRGSVARAERERLAALGLVQCAMGGVMPTPAGRIVARM